MVICEVVMVIVVVIVVVWVVVMVYVIVVVVIVIVKPLWTIILYINLSYAKNKRKYM